MRLTRDLCDSCIQFSIFSFTEQASKKDYLSEWRRTCWFVIVSRTMQFFWVRIYGKCLHFSLTCTVSKKNFVHKLSIFRLILTFPFFLLNQYLKIYKKPIDCASVYYFHYFFCSPRTFQKSSWTKPQKKDKETISTATNSKASSCEEAVSVFSADYGKCMPNFFHPYQNMCTTELPLHI